MDLPRAPLAQGLSRFLYGPFCFPQTFGDLTYHVAKFTHQLAQLFTDSILPVPTATRSMGSPGSAGLAPFGHGRKPIKKFLLAPNKAANSSELDELGGDCSDWYPPRERAP